jgi:hypothetical protein
MTDLLIQRSALLSDCGQYRLRLERAIGAGKVAAGIMVNPSTADAHDDDQTINKWYGFSRRLGFGRFIIGNKFAYRAADVRELRGIEDPIGPENDKHLEQIMRDADVHIVAWGPLSKLPKALRSRWVDIVAIADRVGCPLYCWGTAQDGHPRHPLMLAYSTPLVRWPIDPRRLQGLK